jgi:hypothetical protein
MANYIETSRTNYFRVKDLEAFEDAIAPYGGVTVVHGDNNSIALLGDEYFPDTGWDDDGNDLPKSFSEVISEHLAEDSVFIAMGSGYEKMRYITGWAYAIDSKGKVIGVNIDDIYDKARKKYKGKEVTTATY